MLIKKISKIFKKKQTEISFEDILQEAELEKYNNHQNKMFSKISTFSIYFMFFMFFIISLLFIYNSYLLQIKNFTLYEAKSKDNEMTSIPVFPIRGNILDRNGAVLAKSEKSGTSSEEYVRDYIEKDGLGHVLGYTSSPQKDKKGRFWQENFKGLTGIEEYYDKLLSGVPGKEFFETNAKGEKEKSFIVEKAIPGKDIQLSIDSDLQETAYSYLKKYITKNRYLGGSASMIDLETGEIIFMTNYPEITSYKMNSTATNSKQYFIDLQKREDNPFLNRAISGLYAPGSIMKPVFGLAALQENIITPDTYIYSPGFLTYINNKTGEKTVYKDWKAHGSTNIIEAVAVSSDVFFYSIVGGTDTQKGLGISLLDKYTKSFNIDKKTGIDLFGEKQGNIPTPEWKEKTFGDEWRIGDTFISSIGQFGFLITPLEGLIMTSLIANEGDINTPHLLKEENDFKIKATETIDKKWYSLIKQGMRQVVASDKGTAKSLNLPFVKIAAKTGTAQFGKNKEYIHSWVTGFFPIEKPKYAFIFLLEKSKEQKPDPATLVARDLFWWIWENKKEYFTQQTQ